MNEHRHIVIEGEELYHYGVKGMKWKDHIYAVAEKVGDVAETSAKKVASAASKFAKKANEMKERLTPAAKVAKAKAKVAIKRGAKKASDSIMSTKAGRKFRKIARKVAAAAKNPKKAIQDAKFESMKKRTEAARKPGKEPGMAAKRKVANARRSAGLQATRENLVDMKSRGKIKDPRNTAEAINLMKTVTGTANYNRGKSIAEDYNKYYSDAKKQKQAALAAKARSQKVGKKKPNGR